ncbi:hypothetical protein Hanom_Chr17g01537301 [Helianthus anomalus]
MYLKTRTSKNINPNIKHDFTIECDNDITNTGSDFPLCLVYQNSYVSTNNYIVNSSTSNPINSNTYSSTISSSLTTSLSVKIVHHLLPFNIQNLPYPLSLSLSLSLSLNTIRATPYSSLRSTIPRPLFLNNFFFISIPHHR